MSQSSIAIIGMACRVPAASTYREFWQNLCLGKDGISDLDDNALLASGVSPDDIQNNAYVKRKGTLENVDLFEPQLFGISPSEARLMDPQLRIFLELVWETLEDAGYTSEDDMGVVSVVGSQGTKDTYTETNVLNNPEAEKTYSEFFRTIHHGNDFLATRTSYLFNFTGVSYTVQSACSSSLLAVAQACSLILSKQCDVALAGGINITIPSVSGYRYEKDMILSPSGRCRPFDVNADGTVPGHGGGVVLLKKLEQAIEDGDHIHAVIRGFAMNNDGKRKVGYAAPSFEGQKRVIQQAMKSAQVKPSEIQFVETHGTGTPTGDPIEVSALAEAYQSLEPALNREKASIALGAVKSNVGHLYAGAGVIGLIKTALALQEKTLPGTAHFEHANPLLQLEKTQFYVPTQPIAFTEKQPLHAAVSSFGVGGTNTHMVLQNHREQVSTNATKQPLALVPVSARTETSLSQLLENLNQYLLRSPSADVEIHALAYTLQVGRKPLGLRQCFVVETLDDLKQALVVEAASVVDSIKLQAQSKRLVFHMPPRLTLTAEHIKSLCETYPLLSQEYDSYRAVIVKHCCVDINQHADETEESILALRSYAVYNLMFQFFKSLGVSFSACAAAGESLYAMGVISGVFSFEDGLQLLQLTLQDEKQLESLSDITLHPPKLACVDAHTLAVLPKASIVNLDFWRNATQSKTIHAGNDHSLKILSSDLSPLSIVSFLSIAQSLPETIATLWKNGSVIHWRALYDDVPVKLSLPTYPFNRQRYWLDLTPASNQIPVNTPDVSFEAPALTAQAVSETVKKAFCYHLETEAVSETSDFLSLGGDSISAIHIMTEINKTHALTVNPKIIFTHPTPQKLTAYILSEVSARKEKHVSSQQSKPLKSRERYLASPTQARFWFLETAQQGDFSHYNVPFVFDFVGDINVESLKQSIRDIAYRHEVLRSQFELVGDTLWVNIRQNIPNFLTSHHQAAAFETWSPAGFGQRFNLEQDLLFRVDVFFEPNKTGKLVFNFHHTVMDGMSLDLFFQALSHEYQARQTQAERNGSLTQYAYAEAATLENEWLNSSACNEQLQYWRQSLKGYTNFSLRTDYPETRDKLPKGSKYKTTISPDTVSKVDAFARQHNLTPYMVLFGVFNLLMGKYSGANDLVIGTVVGNRDVLDDQSIIGPFINTLPIRMAVDFNQTSDAYFGDVKQTCLAVFQHQRVPFEKIVRVLERPQQSVEHPLYQVMFILQNQNEQYDLALDQITTTAIESDYQLAQMHLTFNLKKEKGHIQLSVEYRSDLFMSETIEAMVSTYLHLLTQIIQPSSFRLSDLSWVNDTTLSSLIQQKDTFTTAVIDVFERWAEKTPSAIALSVNQQSFTYDTLNQRANQLANYLLPSIGESRQPIAVCLERNEWLIVALLAAMKLGCPYVPIDPTYPKERRHAFLDASGAKNTLVWDNTVAFDTDAMQGKRTHCLKDCLSEILACETVFSLSHDLSPEHAIYQIFTSGSTGTPKLVAVTQANVLNLCQHFESYLSRFKPFSFYAMTSIGFDIFFLEYMLPLFTGGRVVLSSGLLSSNLASVAAEIKKEKPSIIQATPTAWGCLAPFLKGLAHKPCVLVGGEALKETVSRLLLELSPTVYNVYGPTETTVWSTCHPVKSTDDLSIGKPIRNTAVVVADEQKHILPAGVIGEIIIGGQGVTPGYVNDDVLTGEMFISSEALGLRGNIPFYRTGDLGYYDALGRLHVVGRRDAVVKLRGYRVNTLEIESHIETHPAIQSAVVTVRQVNATDTLIAYYIVQVTTSQKALENEVHAFLEKRLPHYMLPTVYIQLDTWPQTKTQKLDRRALPLPETVVASESVMQGGDEIGDLNERVYQVVSQLLNNPNLSAEDNLFAHGLTSLGAIQLCAQLNKMNLEIDIADLFHYPTIKQLSEFFYELQ